MEVIINKPKKYSPKSANLGSTQAKESFTKTVASKAPKIRLFSVTLGYMIAQVFFFNCYFKPEKGISPAAAKVTGLEFKNEKMFLDSRQVEFERSITKVG